MNSSLKVRAEGVNIEECLEILAGAQMVHNEDYCEACLQEIAAAISDDLRASFPLILAIMGGAVVFTGKLLPLLRFPLEFDYLHVSRYRNRTDAGDFQWFRIPNHETVQGKTVLVLDDILDEGQTLACVKEKILAQGAKACYTAVFADKKLNRKKPIKADYVALEVPDRYVFGYGMDIYGYWRNLPAIYAIDKE